MQQIDYTITLDLDIGLYTAEAPLIPNGYVIGDTPIHTFYSLSCAIDEFVLAQMDANKTPTDAYMVFQKGKTEIAERGLADYLYYAADFTWYTSNPFIQEWWVSNNVAKSLGLAPAELRLNLDEHQKIKMMIRTESRKQFHLFLEKLGTHLASTLHWYPIAKATYYDPQRWIRWYEQPYKNYPNWGEIKTIGNEIQYFTLRDDVRTAWNIKTPTESIHDVLMRMGKYDIPIEKLQLNEDTERVLARVAVTTVGDCIDVIERIDNHSGVGHIHGFTEDKIDELKQKLQENGYWSPDSKGDES